MRVIKSISITLFLSLICLLENYLNTFISYDFGIYIFFLSLVFIGVDVFNQKMVLPIFFGSGCRARQCIGHRPSAAAVDTSASTPTGGYFCLDSERAADLLNETNVKRQAAAATPPRRRPP